MFEVKTIKKYFKKIVLVFLILSIELPALFASDKVEKKRLAITPFSASEIVLDEMAARQSPKSEQSNLKNSQYLEPYQSIVRKELVNKMDGIYDVIPDTNTDLQKAVALMELQQLTACEGRCITDIGKATEADLVLSGHISKSSKGIFYIDLKVFNVSNMAVTANVNEEAGSMDYLDKALKICIENLINKLQMNAGINPFDIKVKSSRSIMRVGYGIGMIGNQDVTKYYSDSTMYLVDFILPSYMRWDRGLDALLRFRYRSFRSTDISNLPVSPTGRWDQVNNVTAMGINGDIGTQYRFLGLVPLIHVIIHFNATLHGIYFSETSMHGSKELIQNKFYGLGFAGGAGAELALTYFSGLWVEYNYAYEPIGEKKTNMGGSQVFGGISVRH